MNDTVASTKTSLLSATSALEPYGTAADAPRSNDAGALPVKVGPNLRPSDIIKAAAERENKERRSRGRPKGKGGEGDDAKAPPTRHHIDAHAKAIVASAPDDNDIMLTTGELAAWLRVSPAWLQIGRSKGYGPKFERLATQVVRYRVGDVRKWLVDRQHAHTGQYKD